MLEAKDVMLVCLLSAEGVRLITRVYNIPPSMALRVVKISKECEENKRRTTERKGRSKPNKRKGKEA